MGKLQGEKHVHLKTSHVEEIVNKLKFRIKSCNLGGIT
jgi:hypothetical protein